MSLKFWKKQEVKQDEATLDSYFDVQGKGVLVSDLVINYQNENKPMEKPEKNMANAKGEIEIDGKKVSMDDLKNCYIKSLEKENTNIQNSKDKTEAEEGVQYFDAMQNAIDKGSVGAAVQNGLFDKKEEVKIDLMSDKIERGKKY